jgi:hypothetical protein
VRGNFVKRGLSVRSYRLFAYLSASKLTYVSLVYNEASRLSLATGIGKIAGVLIFFYIVRDSVGLDGWEGSDFRLLLLLACAAFMVVWYFFMRSTRAVSFAPARAAHLRCSAQAAFLAFAGLRGGRSHRHRDTDAGVSSISSRLERRVPDHDVVR